MSSQLRIAGVIKESIVDGPGYRYVVFAQGCPHHCEGCHNPETHDFEAGYLTDISKIVESVKKDSLLSGITLSGGEPFCQAEAFSKLSENIHALGLNVICFTGFLFGKLLSQKEEHPEYIKLLNQIDILIDGPFILNQKSLSLKFRGSKNQRVIDVKKSLKNGETVQIEFE